MVRDVVAERAAHELPLVDGLRELSDERVVRVLSGGGRRREALGFGYAEAATMITPVVWLVLDQVARRGVDAATDSAVRRSRWGLRRLLRGGSAEEPRTLTELDRAQLAAVRARVVERATAQGISGEQAEALADSVVARLATGDPAPDAPDAPGSSAPAVPPTTPAPQIAPDASVPPTAPPTPPPPGAPTTPR
ncbi:hypothetical protein OG349_07245 [Streptomyces sp. NBC_01317]|uniref:hypothetical protein n=1 Tax=Streptomyces sp. NBC_01317 TaxID=2903822 RepID=UPI002E151F6D|nr:hypothetical protein OG349_07245 [Streptomyces sp. NBC_01317]